MLQRCRAAVNSYARAAFCWKGSGERCWFVKDHVAEDLQYTILKERNACNVHYTPGKIMLDFVGVETD